MPSIPWAVGERETVDAAKYAGERRLNALAQWGNIAGTGVRLYKDAKTERQAREQQDAAEAEYDRIEGQTAEQLRKQEEDKKAVSSTSVSKIADAAEEDPLLGGFSAGVSTPGDYSTRDQPAGVSTPGSAAQDVQSSQQQPGSKPATPTQQGATSEANPPPATKVDSADDSTKALHKVATSPKNFGSFVTGVGDTIGGIAKTAYHAVGDLGGGHLWDDLGSIIGIDDPAKAGQLSRHAQFLGRAQLRGEQDKRAASLASVATQMARPMEAVQGFAPFALRNLPPGIRNMPTAAADKANKNPNMWRVLYEAAGGDKNPLAWQQAENSYEKLQVRLAKARRGGLTTEQFIRELMFGDAADQAAAREYARFAAENGLTKAPIETTQQKMAGVLGTGAAGTAPIDYGTMQGRGTEPGGAAGGGGGEPATTPVGRLGARRGNADPTRLPALAFDARWKKAEAQYHTPPNLVRAMAWQESGFRPGEQGIEHPRLGIPLGLGQFMSKGVAARFGITPENYQDVDKQIAAMNQYLTELYQEQIQKGDDNVTAWRRAVQRYHGIGPDRLGVTHSQYWRDVSEKLATLDAMEHGSGSGTQEAQVAGGAAAATPPPHPQAPAGPSTSQPVGPSTAAGTPANPAMVKHPAPPGAAHLRHPLKPGQVRVEPLPEPTTTTTVTPPTTTSTTKPATTVDPALWALYYEQAEQLPPGQFPPWHPLGEGGLPTLPPGVPPAWPPLAGFPPDRPLPTGQRPLAQLAEGAT